MMSKYWDKNIECAKREKIFALQNKRFLKQLQRVYKNLPHYREKLKYENVEIKDIISLRDLYKLPFTTKEDITDTYPFGLFAVPKKDIIRIHTSSGTTGKPKIVGYTQKDIEMWQRCCARAFTAIGVTKKDVVHISYGYGLFTGGLGIHYGSEMVGAMTVPVGTGNTQKQAMLINDLGSTCICCTPSYALFLAEELEKMCIHENSLRVGFLGAEVWTEEMRKEIQIRLGIKAYDIYGLSEIMGPGVAFECEYQNGLHINEDNFVAEIIDPDTLQVLGENQKGELVITCITKEGFPLIRYRTGDICSITSEKCKCGRTFIRMSKIIGRTDDMCIIRGVNVFPSQIESVLINFGYSSPKFYLYIDRINNRDILDIVVLKDESILKREQEVKKSIESVLGLSVNIRFVDNYEVEEGKIRKVFDNRK